MIFCDWMWSAPPNQIQAWPINLVVMGLLACSISISLWQINDVCSVDNRTTHKKRLIRLESITLFEASVVLGHFSGKCFWFMKARRYCCTIFASSRSFLRVVHKKEHCNRFSRLFTSQSSMAINSPASQLAMHQEIPDFIAILISQESS